MENFFLESSMFECVCVFGFINFFVIELNKYLLIRKIIKEIKLFVM